MKGGRSRDVYVAIMLCRLVGLLCDFQHKCVCMSRYFRYSASASARHARYWHLIISLEKLSRTRKWWSQDLFGGSLSLSLAPMVHSQLP